jgi:branched-chain amino acid transport system permease protein
MSIVQHLIDAVSLGLLYAIFALGIAFVFSIGKVINFAHGELIMAGSYVLALMNGVDPIIATIAVLATIAILALIIERVAVAPIKDDSSGTSVLVATFAVSMLLQNVALMVFGPRAKPIELGSNLLGTVEIGGLVVVKLSVITIGALGVVMLFMVVGINRTRLGAQFRATAADPLMARLVGIPSQRIVAIAFLVSGALAGIASILFAIQVGAATPAMGLTPVLIAFVAIAIGGLGSLTAAALGGVTLGCFTVALQVLLPDGAQPFREAILFGGVIVLLLFRPNGLFRSSTTGERV